MDSGKQDNEPGDTGLGSDEIRVLGWPIKRKHVAGTVTLSFMLLGVILLFTGYMEGGALVSMWTLALGTGAIVLVWNRIEQFTLFGSEIRLRRLTRDAESLMAGLDESRADLYRTALGLAQRMPDDSDNARQLFDSRTREVLPLLRRIENAGLLERLTDEALSATETLIESTRQKLLSPKSPLREAINGADSQSPEAIPAIYAEWLSEAGPANEHQAMAQHATLSHAIDELSELLRYRHAIAETSPRSR
ncbi:hypothetical protein [Halomonas sp. WWR20]